VSFQLETKILDSAPYRLGEVQVENEITEGQFHAVYRETKTILKTNSMVKGRCHHLHSRQGKRSQERQGWLSAFVTERKYSSKKPERLKFKGKLKGI
jgi:hypothetical protein